MKLQVLGDNLLVTEIKGEAKSASGILLTRSEETYKTGIIKYLGQGEKLSALPVKVGDTILFANGQVSTINGEEFILIKEDNILAKCQNK